MSPAVPCIGRWILYHNLFLLFLKNLSISFVEVELIYSVPHGNFNVAFITGLMPDFVSISW